MEELTELEMIRGDYFTELVDSGTPFDEAKRLALEKFPEEEVISDEEVEEVTSEEN